MEPVGSPLRVGLLLDTWRVPAWVARVVEDIRGADFAEVALVVLNAAPPRLRSRERLLAKRHELLWRAYMALDALFFRPRHDPFARCDLEPLLAGVPVVRVAPERKRFTDTFPDAALEEIRGHALDVAFRFGFRILRGGALEIARHGVWSYHHGDNEVNRGGPPGFWEVVRGEPVTGSVLQVLTPELDDGRVLYRSWSATHPYSVTASRARVYNKSAAFALRALRELHDPGSAGPPMPDARGAYRPYTHPLHRTPTNRQMAPLLLRLAGRMAAAGVRNALYRGAWMVAYRLGPPGGLPNRLYDFTPLLPPKGRHWADPFALVEGGRRFVFLEEWSDGAARAHIAAIEILPEGTAAEPVTVLERPYHLSYPCVFRWNGELWMVPETRANRTVELYRCAELPQRWVLERVLLEDVEAVDATLAEVEGRWWMWLNRAEPGASLHDELHLYHAPSPLGPWTPHRRNPVRSDVRSARPAGRLLRVGGELIRPAQDASVRYGYAVTFNRVTCLTPEEYAEEPVGKLLPLWRRGLLGTHTFNHDGGLTVVDGYWERRRLF